MDCSPELIAFPLKEKSHSCYRVRNFNLGAEAVHAH
jgi:hypothetical protein